VTFLDVLWVLWEFDVDVLMLIRQVTFLVTHFSDVRIANSDVRDILLQSISVLVQYKEHVIAFERSQAAREGMVGSLLASFDNRFWIPVSNILLRLCKGSGFGASKCLSHGESFSPHFQVGEMAGCWHIKRN
jgi:Kip1 ubiquitination-promoting complex protein 1